jgi:hypothetical protein
MPKINYEHFDNKVKLTASIVRLKDMNNPSLNKEFYEDTGIQLVWVSNPFYACWVAIPNQPWLVDLSEDIDSGRINSYVGVERAESKDEYYMLVGEKVSSFLSEQDLCDMDLI